MKIGQDLYPKITEVFFKRLSLFLHGDRDGVSLNTLTKNTSGGGGGFFKYRKVYN